MGAPPVVGSRHLNQIQEHDQRHKPIDGIVGPLAAFALERFEPKELATTGSYQTDANQTPLAGPLLTYRGNQHYKYLGWD